MGEGVVECENPEGRGGSSSFGIPGGGGRGGGGKKKKTDLLSWGCGFFLE